MSAGTEDTAHILALALVRVGADLESIWDELARAGYGQEAAIARERLADFAPDADAKARLFAYWREYAMERLSALRGPLNVLKDRYYREPAYRSPLLAELRELAPTLPPSRIQSPQIEPSIKRYLDTPLNTPAGNDARRRVREAKAQAIVDAGLADDPLFDTLPWNERVQLMRERFAQTMAPHGFTVKNKGKNVVVAERPTTDGRFIYAFFDSSGANLGSYNQLQHQIAIRTPKQRFSHIPPKDESIARFTIQDIVPEFHWSSNHFRNYPEFCRTVDSAAYAALCIFHRLDAVLIDSPDHE